MAPAAMQIARPPALLFARSARFAPGRAERESARAAARPRKNAGSFWRALALDDDEILVVRLLVFSL